MSGESEVDATTVLSDDGVTLEIFLYHADPAGRSKAEETLYRAGAQFVPYPSEQLPLPTGSGRALIEDVTVSVQVGPLLLIAPLELPARELKAVERAVLYVLREPYDRTNKTKGNLLAATLPLDVTEREEI